MKQNNSIFLFILTFTVLNITALKAAEEPIYQDRHHQKPSTTTTTSTTYITQGQLVDEIDTDINRRYGNKRYGLFTGLFGVYKLSENDLLDIFNLISSYCDEEKDAENLSDALSAKNNLFKQSVDHLVQEAVENIKSVTPFTIETVENPELLQAKHMLNMIAKLILKKFIINKAKKHINYNYTRILAGHTGIIDFFDIHIPTGYVLTASKDKTIRLWNLNNDKTIPIRFKDRVSIELLCFNPTGSHFATVTYSPSNKRILMQWKINELGELGVEKTHACQYQPDKPYHISYFNDNSLLAIHGYDSFSDRRLLFQRMILFKKNGKTSCLGQVTIPFSPANPSAMRYGNNQTQHWCLPFEKTPYTAEIPKDNQKILSITKECHDLYLCKQAIKNSPPSIAFETLQSQIEKSQSYQNLNRHEQREEKHAALKAIEDKK